MQKRTLFISILISNLAFGQENDTLVYNTRQAIMLEGASNFRGLGGYPTQDSHHVKGGHLYRCAYSSKLGENYKGYAGRQPGLPGKHARRY